MEGDGSYNDDNGQTMTEVARLHTLSRRRGSKMGGGGRKQIWWPEEREWEKKRERASAMKEEDKGGWSGVSSGRTKRPRVTRNEGWANEGESGEEGGMC